MIALSNVSIGGIVVGLLILIIVFATLRSMVNIVQQGEVGVVKRLGEYRKTHEPGLVIIAPFIDSLQHVDMREIPVPGDRQEVITRDNVVVTVNATIFTQIVDAKQALFSVSNFNVAIDALARTALRSVIGTLSLDESLSERERINTDVQSQMEAVTDKWGIRIARIEIMEITPPPKILEALALQKQADQEKRAKILQSEGTQQSAINIADGEAKAAIRSAEGQREAAILRAEGKRQAFILEAEGRAQAITSVYSAITAADPDPTLDRDPATRDAQQVRRQRQHQDRRAVRERGPARRRPGVADRAQRRAPGVAPPTRRQCSRPRSIAARHHRSDVLPTSDAPPRPRLRTRF